jgi:hypothetical protein
MTSPASISNRLRPTLGSEAWVRRHQGKICALMPLLWTPAGDPEFLVRFGIGLKLLGVDWSDPAELLVAIHWLAHIQLVDTLPLSPLEARQPLPKALGLLMIQKRAYQRPWVC